MNPLKLAAALATDAPHLLADFVKLWNDTVHGSGGFKKVAADVADVEAIVTDAAPVAAAVAAAAG